MKVGKIMKIYLQRVNMGYTVNLTLYKNTVHICGLLRCVQVCSGVSKDLGIMKTNKSYCRNFALHFKIFDV